jgi:glycosyltransferase involved in cell wall biosynthesis
MISVVIPVHGNEENISSLIERLDELNRSFDGALEVVFVVDGSPDASLELLEQALPKASFRSQLLNLSRNFGAFAALRAGMEAAKGDYIAVIAADLQEPPELVGKFYEQLKTGQYDVAFGERLSRVDRRFGKMFSAIFWGFYRKFVQTEIPSGGVDTFACTKAVRDELMRCGERNSSLIGLLFWVGFRRVSIPYDRTERQAGVSAWTFSKRVRYLSNSVFSFTDLPVRVLLYIGLLGILLSLAFGFIVLIMKSRNAIEVPGYTATVLLVTFFGGLNCFGLGLIGSYVWRAYENTKRRPNYIVSSHDVFTPDAGGRDT